MGHSQLSCESDWGFIGELKRPSVLVSSIALEALHVVRLAHKKSNYNLSRPRIPSEMGEIVECLFF